MKICNNNDNSGFVLSRSVVVLLVLTIIALIAGGYIYLTLKASYTQPDVGPTVIEQEDSYIDRAVEETFPKPDLTVKPVEPKAIKKPAVDLTTSSNGFAPIGQPPAPGHPPTMQEYKGSTTMPAPLAEKNEFTPQPADSETISKPTEEKSRYKVKTKTIKNGAAQVVTVSP